VEFPWPGDENLTAIRASVRKTGLKVVLMNIDAGDMARGERGFLNDSSRKAWLHARASKAIEFAQQIGCPRLNVLVGNNIQEKSREEQLDQIRENLAWISDQAATAGIGIVVEALNSFESPNYLLTNTHDTLALLSEVNRPNLKYQYDMYHMQRMEGNLIATLREYISWIGHIQIADAPERHEPGSGEIHFPHVLAALDKLGYQGYIGLEYNPIRNSDESFAWLPADRLGEIAVGDLHL
ncbi:MAG TPA: TIM barrel protein, partial [Ktedonobacteraceae bacterium]|nr:TIM barrel protein [Ktedonobacteraceae bacterium]